MVISKPRITVIGSLNTDLITRTARLPVPGETVISQSFDTGCGGKGANQAVACARLSRSRSSPQHGSIDVGMDGAVGDDLFGKTLLEGLHDNYVDTTDVKTRENEKSGVATIIVEEQTGENRILMSPNANYSLKPERYTTLGEIHPDLIIMQLEIPLDTTLGILKAAKERKIEVVFNPAPAQKLPEEAYEAISHLIVNESEAAIITGNEGKDLDWSLRGLHMEHLFNLGVQHIVVTLGARGVLYHNTIEAYTKTFKAEKVEVKDTTAAGDTFVGAYAVAILRNGKDRSPETMARAVAWANKAAGKTVEREGAQAAIPWLDDMPTISETDSSRIKED